MPAELRLDAWVARASGLSRNQARKAIADGRVQLAGQVVRDPAQRLAGQSVCLDGEILRLNGPRYLMLHKPAGTVCSARADGGHTPVLELLPAAERAGLLIVGRLDQDTTGLLLLTDDGAWAHRVTAPRRACAKVYRVGLSAPLAADAEARLAAGLVLASETRPLRPATLQRVHDTEVLLTIHEGRYHQVKRMMAALGSRVQCLHRERIGSIALDPQLAPGQWRVLSADEQAAV